MNKLLILVVFTMIYSSCTYSIKYNLTDINKSSEDELKDLSISIQIIEDLRKQDSPHKRWLFSNNFKNKTNCFNIEKGYGKLIVPEEIEKILTEHIRTKGYFRRVLIGKPDSVDFSISMKLKSFVGKTKVNAQAQTANELGSQFGMIGALGALSETSKMNSELLYSIEYIEINIHDNNKNKDLPECIFSSIDTSTIPVITNCNQIYSQLNKELKKHNEAFSALLTQKIGSYLSGKDIEIEEIGH